MRRQRLWSNFTATVQDMLVGVAGRGAEWEQKCKRHKKKKGTNLDTTLAQ